ncbi:MAG: pyridoxamine 5'-phosphate oxidase family protein [Prolixibacteraceae bacterium]
MNSLPQIVNDAWDSRNDIIVLSTVDINGMPNSIYATCVKRYNDTIFVVADNYFNKTRKNILDGSKTSLLFITKEGKSFQLKGHVAYLQSGIIYNDMKQWNPSQHPGNAAVALEVEEIYSGSEKLL